LQWAKASDAKSFAVADKHGTLQFIDAASGETVTGFKTVEQPVDLAWNPEGGTLAILAYKTTLQLWDVSP